MSWAKQRGQTKSMSELNYDLCIIRPFRHYVPGQYITDPKEAADLLKSHSSYVVKVNKPAKPPATASKSKVETTPKGAE